MRQLQGIAMPPEKKEIVYVSFGYFQQQSFRFTGYGDGPEPKTAVTARNSTAGQGLVGGKPFGRTSRFCDVAKGRPTGNRGVVVSQQQPYCAGLSEAGPGPEVGKSFGGPAGLLNHSAGCASPGRRSSSPRPWTEFERHATKSHCRFVQ